MPALIARRLLQLPIILAVIYSLTLFLAWKVPGNPLENPEGRKPPPAVVEAMKRQYKLDSFGNFYWSYLESATGLKWVGDMFSGRAAEARTLAAQSGQARPERYIFDLGPSLKNPDWRVNQIIADSLPVSMTLGLAAILIALVLGLGAGVIGAVRPNSFADLSTLAIALVGISMPSFVIGTALVLIFPVWLGIGSLGGWGTVGKLVLPALTLSLPFAAYIARLTRMGMVEHLRADFIRTARAKGVDEWTTISKHAFRNTLIPVVTVLGITLSLLIGGSVVIEQVFALPGIGRLIVQGILARDYPLVQGTMLLFGFAFVVINIMVDIIYTFVDPRVRYG